jgi:hypothetical protein
VVHPPCGSKQFLQLLLWRPADSRPTPLSIRSTRFHELHPPCQRKRKRRHDHAHLALVNTHAEFLQLQEFFLSQQPPGTTGYARRLNPDIYYLACRWDYDITPSSVLRAGLAILTILPTANPRRQSQSTGNLTKRPDVKRIPFLLNYRPEGEKRGLRKPHRSSAIHLSKLHAGVAKTTCAMRFVSAIHTVRHNRTHPTKKRRKGVNDMLSDNSREGVLRAISALVADLAAATRVGGSALSMVDVHPHCA